MSIRKLNLSNIEYNTSQSFPYGTLWFDELNRLRVSDGVTGNGQVLLDPSAAPTGLAWQGTWNPSGSYIANVDVVLYNGNSYLKILGNGNSGSSPDGDPIRWQALSSPGSSITNTDGNNTWAVSVATTGVITMNTGRGGLEFGAMPEIGGPTHLHIMRPAGQNSSTDLFFGDDFNYVKMPGLYGIDPNYQQGVEIGSSLNNGTVSIWRFGTDGSTTFPNGSKLDGGTAYKFATDNTVVQYIDMRDSSGRGFYTDTSGFSLRADGSNTWTFALDGSVTTPKGTVVSDLVSGPTNVFGIFANSVPGRDVLIRTSPVPGVFNKDWKFGADGTTTFPNNSIVIAAGLTLSTNYRKAIATINGIVSQTMTGNGYIIVTNITSDIFAGINLNDLVGATFTIVSQSNTILDVTALGANIDGNLEYSVHLSGPSTGLTGGQGVPVSIEKAEQRNDWQFSTDGRLQLPLNGSIIDINGQNILADYAVKSYTPTTASDWAGTAPTTIQEALDRLAAAVKAINTTGA